MTEQTFYRWRKEYGGLKLELAKLIVNGITARGLTIKLFAEARKKAEICPLAIQLLYRVILAKLTNGWSESEEGYPTVRMGSWHSDVARFAPEYKNRALSIMNALVSQRNPKLGWKPSGLDDEFLTSLFNEFWPESED